jgi:hypothetical protein
MRFFIAVLCLILTNGTTGYGKTDSLKGGLALHFNFGTKGLGLEAQMKLRSRVSMTYRGGINILSYTKPFSIKAEDNSFLEAEPDIVSVSPFLFLDYYPFRKKVFHISAGAEYTVLQSYASTFYTKDQLKIGGVEMLAEDFGVVDFQIEWNRFKPYLGVGLKRDVMQNRIGIGMDLGCFYMGSPKLSLSYEGFLETTTIDDEVLRIQERMKGYAFYPYLSFQIRYKIKP